MVAAINIANRKVGVGEPCFIIAEAGVNHNGDLKLGHQLIDQALKAGADAVKFQTFKADRLVSPEAPKAKYQLETTDTHESHFEMIRRLELSPQMHRQLLAHCQDIGILFMSSCFDEDSADLLEELEVALFKIPSGEITNLPFLAHVARKGRPMIVSTGMAYLGEVETAVHTIQQAGNQNVVLLQCTSNYPANPADVNLRAMLTMCNAFNLPVGYSDHTPGIEVPLAAVAIGACVIEKHFTLDRNLPGPDHRASLEPPDLAAMVRGIRTVEAALGDGLKVPAESEANTASVARKSLVAGRDLPAGTVLIEDMMALKRPGTGLPAAMRDYLVGRTLRVSLQSGTLFSLEVLG